MPIAGLVLTLDGRPQAPLKAALAQAPGVSLGEPQGTRLPIVLESASQQAFDVACRELAALHGVLQVELAFADFSDLPELADYVPLRRGRTHVGGDDGPA
jgi:nitrate reductase NapAB chaperone NapD